MFESGVVIIQQGRVVTLKEIEKHTCRKLFKSYKIVWDEDENEELIEPSKDDAVLTTHIGMTDILKNECKRKIDDTKDENLYKKCRFIYESVARAKKLFSHFKYTETDYRNRLTPQLFEAITFWKVIDNFGKFIIIILTYNIDELMTIFTHINEWKKTKQKEREWTEIIINSKINIAYYIDSDYND